MLAIARKTRTLLLRRGYRVAMTRTGPVFRYGTGGNVARAQFCNRRQREAHAPHPRGRLVERVQPRRLDALPRAPPRLDGRHLRAEPPRRARRPERNRGRDRRPRPRPRPPRRPDRLQLGERPLDPRRDRVHDEPEPSGGSSSRAPTSGRSPAASPPEWRPSLPLRAPAHLLGDLAPALVHRAAAVAELRRDGLGLVDRRLGRLELLAVVGDDARLGELRLQRLRVRLRNDSAPARGASAPGTPRLRRPPRRRAKGPAGLARGRCYSVARHLPRPRRLVPERRKNR